jgi:hypothetical protein
MTQPPNTPEYAAPLPPLPPKYPHAWRGLLIGAGIGGAVSLVVWVFLFAQLDKMPWLLVVIPLLKIAFGIALVVRSRQTRFAGIGLLLSIPLGALIFMGACFGQIIKGA